MPKIHVAKTKDISAPIEAVYKAVRNMGEWQTWSPWLIMEPDADVSVAPDGESYEWRGERVGEGSMRVTDSVENKSVDYDLVFLSPWKSHAKVRMDLSPIDGGTRVIWSMDSALPFYLFFMTKMMHIFIGMDYERGLNLLKDYVEDGKVHSSLKFLEPMQYPGSHYVGIERTCAIGNMAEKMTEDFKRLMPWAATHNLNTADSLCIYHTFNMHKGICKYTAGVRFVDLPKDVPEDFVTGRQAPTMMIAVEHTGPYHHLGNAWSTMHNMIQNKTFKTVKNYAPFETYLNSPETTDPKDLVTRVNFALKT